MKRLLIIIGLIASQTAWANCTLRSATINQSKNTIGAVTNLQKIETYGKCTVKFQIKVNGTNHDLSGEYFGMEVPDVLCQKAVEETKQDFLEGIAGEFKTQAITVCQEGSAKPDDRIKIGDHILENEVGTSPIKDYFKYKGAKCRMFQEHLSVQRKLRVYNGVICQIDNSDTNWLVVDKW